MTETTGLLFSGGLDSSVLLVHLLDEGRVVQPVYIDSELVWQRCELAAARRFLAAIAWPDLREMIVLRLPLADIYGRHWSITGFNAPDAATPDEAVYLPGRNPLLIIKARLWCQQHDIGTLALGCLSTNPFPDATDDFFDRFETVLNQADSGSVQFVRPFAALDKRAVMQLGKRIPLHLTFSCIAPRGSLHCGRCNKCAERQMAFRLIGETDPTQYANTAAANSVSRT